MFDPNLLSVTEVFCQYSLTIIGNSKFSYTPTQKFLITVGRDKPKHGIIGVHRPPPKILGPPLIPTLQVPP